MEPKYFVYQLDRELKPSFKDHIDELPEGWLQYTPPNSGDLFYYKTENSKPTEVIIVNKNGRDYSDKVVAKFSSLLPF
ncbi:MAG: hypothetical protein B7X86_13640 [Sphingobacteriales bacterium 17-39-43]|uniref:hypothetical protein n=1 Tax=Daejeonella sp. TaxID=2805397 RepID=UPI000BD9313C|nr:hypothetical protein [Daejeonella sp.]OYZ28273.1 MAG: hypothetical protein B7Y24_16905 [Sphingobacteriales bacterium 16-39-50]OZA23147.1 MAG: hypothetical protein B7X86_13640 [Sphingobacteriales bacterium 17-39-43]HQT24699.1 hypothetical protein [Daejeonella sp.]HQT59385.1 hypothetical protein [Daejeonella sp.]